MLHALTQCVGGDVNQFHLVGLVQNPVRQRFAHTHARDACHQVVQALQVLDIERGHHVDARIEDLLDILIAFGVLRTRDVGMGQFIDQRHFGMPGNDGLGIHLLKCDAAIGDLLARNGF